MAAQSPRKGLVVGARWLAINGDQNHISEAADLLATGLFDPALGACEPALDGVRVVQDPARNELDNHLTQAFAAASRSGSLLAICLVGHGYRATSNGPYYFVPSDHPATFDDAERYGYPIAERILSLDAEYHDTDGLILLVDACHSGQLSSPGKRDWTSPMRRLALATSTGTGSAWSAGFSRLISEGMESGIPDAGRLLKIGDFGPLLAQLATGPAKRAQSAHELTFNDSPDKGLWISANRAVKVSRIADLVRQVTRHQGLYRITDRYQRPEISDLLADAIGANRAVAVLGPSGCGKSATLQMIAIDGLDPERTGYARKAGEPWQGVAFFPAAADSTTDYFALQVYEQLNQSSYGEFEKAAQAFLSTVDEAEWGRLSSTERWLTGPIRNVPDDASVLLVVDGLDQLPPVAADGVIDCLSELASTEYASDVRIVVSARHRPDHAQPRIPAGFAPVTMPDPSSLQIRRYLSRRRIPESRLAEVESVAAGNWLIITLLCNGLTDQPERSGGLPRTRDALYNDLLDKACSSDRAAWASRLAPVMAVLTCAGAGVALPLTVLRAASGPLGGPDSFAAVRESIVYLHRVVERIEPGTADEHVMLIHPTLVEHLSSPLNAYAIPPLAQAHSAVAAALATLAPMAGGGTDDEAAREYANRSEATHRWEAGDYAGAVTALIGRPSSSARGNRDRWVAWTRRITDRFGPAHRLSLEARQQLAFWTSRCGLFSDALGLYRELVPLVRSSLGEDDPLALRILFDEAMCRGVNGHPGETRDRLLLLEPAVTRAVGPFVELTLEIRHAVGSWTGLAGEPRAAVSVLRPVLEDCQSHLGQDHPETLACRNSLARWTGESGEPARAVQEFRALLPAQTQRLGRTHRETLRTRYSIAYWSGEAGRPQETLQLLKELIEVQRSALGDEHPDTLRTLHGIGLWTGVTGDPAEAVRILSELLPVRERVLGPDHPDTLRTLNNLGRWAGTLGQHARAIEILEDTLERRTRTLGPDHPDTMRTVNNIIDWTGAAGEYRRAYELAGQLLPVQQRVLGNSHQDTMRTRFNQARWLAADGDAAAAMEQLRALYQDQVAALGEQHPDSLRTARTIEELASAGQG
jgi:Tetratricopeptide repeat